MQNTYHPANDPYFSEPYIDVQEIRQNPLPHYYVHGGFKGTDLNGTNEVRFCFYYPMKEAYQGRFFQYFLSDSLRFCTDQQTFDCCLKIP